MGNLIDMKPQEIDSIYNELREDFAIIGLTGALGSGCTTSAKILSNALDNNFFKTFSDHYLSDISNKSSLEEYRLKKIETFINNKTWKSFYHLKVSNLLYCIFFNHTSKIYCDDFQTLDWFKNHNNIIETQKLCTKIVSLIMEPNGNKKTKDNRELSESLIELDNNIKINVIKNSNYTKDFQKIGELLRENGLKEFINFSNKTSTQPSNNVFAISEFVKNTIQHLRNEGHAFFVLDALRNLHEINYFKARYSNFYLFSVQADEPIRKQRLLNEFGYKEQDYEAIKKNELNKNKNHSQNINACLSNGDVFISNNQNHEEYLKFQLIKYVCLMRKPGLFTPTKDERNMQIALTARYNSGCISRQVGACVVGKDGYILGIGWNDVPENSIPCVYRSSKSLILHNNSSPEFSAYETSDIFKNYIRNEIGSNDHPFCFKDLENKRVGKQEIATFKQVTGIEISSLDETVLIKKLKNPTRERALHAEENAFLQSAKVGGGSLKHSTLYTTASPCQLCAKKAMQLGISRIIYIDAYPDISNEQTLKSGNSDKWPKVEAFLGVAESAFMKLYKPLINIKDEVESHY